MVRMGYEFKLLLMLSAQEVVCMGADSVVVVVAAVHRYFLSKTACDYPRLQLLLCLHQYAKSFPPFL